MRTRHDVAIVGAGVAGLACAKVLARSGRSPVVLERADGVGGRVRTDVVDGFRLDRGFQVLPTAYPEVRRLLDQERLELHAFHPGAIVRRDGRFRRVADPRRSPVRGLRSLAGGVVTPRDAIALARLRRDGAETTIAEALRRARIGEGARRGLLTPFLRGITLDPGLGTSSTLLRFVLDAFGEGAATLPARGMQAVPEQLAEGLDVRLDTPVGAVGPGLVTLADGTSIEADAVVVATAGLLDDAAHGWNGVACIHWAAPEAPLPGAWLVLDGDDEGPVNDMCVPSEVAPTYAPPGRALVSASVPGVGEPDLDAVDAQLRRWFGRATARWSRLAVTVVEHAVPRLPVGAGQALPPRLSDGLYACGDHREHPSLNGALHSGRRAAEAILADAG